MTVEKIPASVGILTFNNRETIERALASVRMFDDIVICDGGSTDGTREIAERAGARVIEQDARFKNADGLLRDYGGVRQQLLEAATREWFLYIDSDESVSDGLREEIRDVVSRPVRIGSPLVYRVPIRTIQDGREILFSSNYPGYQHRFFNKKSGAHFIKQVHERIAFDASVITGTLSHPWYVYSTREEAGRYLRETARYRAMQVRMSMNRSFKDYLRFDVYRGLRASLGALLKSMRNYILHGFKESAPIGEEWGRFLSPLLVVWGITYSRLARKLVYLTRKNTSEPEYAAWLALRSRRSDMPIRLFVLPANIATNPYLTLLYGAIRAESSQYSAQEFSWRDMSAALLRREKVVAHIHWETNIYGSRFIAVSLWRGFWRFSGLLLARACGAPIVWTMHNMAAHDYPHPRIDGWGRAIMWRIADAVIIQNRAAAARLAREHPGMRVAHIPHGNYIGAYGLIAPERREDVRRAYGVAEGSTVLLALGLVRPYKRYERLVDAVARNARNGGSVKLLIAGKGEKGYLDSLRARAGGSPAVVFTGFIPDKDIPGVHAAADYGIFAYGGSSLTSGAIPLSLSYGLPVLIGDMPAAEYVMEGVNGYRWKTDAELDALLAALPGYPPLDRERVIVSVAPYSWEEVARQTIAVYRSCV